MSTGRSNLTKNERGISQNFFGAGDPFAERAWVSSKNMVREQFEVSPINPTVTRGSDTTFQISKLGDRFGRMVLYWTRAAYTNGLVTDYEAPFSVDKISFRYSNKEFYVIYGEDLFHMHNRDATQEDRSNIANAEGGLLTANERLFASGVSKNLWLDLRVPWAAINKCIRIAALPNTIDVVVSWATTARTSTVLNGGPISGGTITLPYIKCDFYHLTQAERVRIAQEVHSVPLNTKYKGLEYHRREVIPTNASTGTITNRLKLRNIKNDAFEIWGVIRTVTSVDNDATILLLNPTAFLAPPAFTYWIEDNGTRITVQYTYDTFNKYNEQPKGHENQLGTDNYFSINLANDPVFLKMCGDDCYGSRAIVKYNNPELVMSFTGPTTSDYYLDCFGSMHNVIVQHKGDVRKFLT